MADALSGAETPEQDLEALTARIREAPARLWSRLRSSLGVETREAAVELVQQDAGARRVAQVILGVREQAGEQAPEISTAQSAPAMPTRKGQSIKF